MKFWKFLLTLVGVVLGSVGTLLFQPTVFCEITLPVAAKLAGWKAQAVAARLSAFGTLEIQGLEAVDEKKSRIAMDSAKVEFDPFRLLTGRPEILRADFRFAMVDLEIPSAKKRGPAQTFSLPFSLREASVDLMEGRLRTEKGAWIVKSAHASAEGWDGRTPREIQVQLGRLDWNGPGQQELATTTQATATKAKDAVGAEVWNLKLTTDVSTVVDLPPWQLVTPCRLVVAGQAGRSARGDWKVEGLQMDWQGLGGIRLAAQIGGTYEADGNWSATLELKPTDLQLAGIFLQPRGVENVYGTLGGTLRLGSGKGKPLEVEADLIGQTVQLAAAGGTTWPPQPAALTLSSKAEWRPTHGVLKLESLAGVLVRTGQPADFQLTLDRPAFLQITGKPKAEAPDPASLQWTLRGLEMAALAPLFFDLQKLKVQGGKLSANGSAKIEGARVGLSGRVESRSMIASGSWVQGNLAVQAGTLDFRGYLEGGTKLHLETAQLKAAWEGGASEDLSFSARAEWDWEKSEGFMAGDLEVGLIGLGKAWSGAQFWPEAGLGKLHLEFSGNPQQKGSGLASLTLTGMRWPGEKEAPWQAKLVSEAQAQQGGWILPGISLSADRGGSPLLDGQASLRWYPNKNEGSVKLELARAESSLVVPLLKIFTPEWQWSEASGQGSLQFDRKDRHDRVAANLRGVITVETGTATRPRPVDFSSVEGNLQASWPSGSEGMLSIEALALVAKHRDGTEAIRASLDAPLSLKKKGPGEWEPTGTQASSGLIQFGGWPLGIVAPLVLPEAKENSIAGTLSGYLRVKNDPKNGSLAAQLDLSSPDLSANLPHLRLPENQVSLKADLALGEDRNLAIQKVAVASRQAGLDWLELSAEKATHPGLAVSGKADLATLSQNVPVVTPFVSAGTLLWKANVGDPKDGLRKVGFSAQAQGLTAGLPEIGTMAGLQATAQGLIDWGKEGFVSLDDLNLTADGPGGKLQIGKLDFRRNGALAWESGRASQGWVAVLAQPWLKPNRWVDGDVVLGQGFWEPGEHGSSGEIDGSLLEARISERKDLAPLSGRFRGDWEYDNRTKLFVLKNAILAFPEFKDNPVEISSLQAGPELFQTKVTEGVLDLRGVLDQYGAWQSAPSDPARPPRIPRLDISAELDQVVLTDARVGPVKIARFRYGPDGILLEPSSVEVQGGMIRGSVVQTGGADRPLQARLFAEKFPLAAILGPMIQDARGPLGGWADLQFTGQASGAKLEDLQRTLTGQGNFRLYQAHLENLPAIGKALQGAGQFLGSSFIAGSEINDLSASFQASGSKISTQDLQVSGTALAAGMRGSLDWVTQGIDFQVNLALTREAIQSSGQLQGVMTQLIGSNTDYYTKIPGSATITGTLSDPVVQMDVTKMLAQAGINLLLNAPSGVLQGAGGAAGGATGAAGSILQGVGNLFKGF